MKDNYIRLQISKIKYEKKDKILYKSKKLLGLYPWPHSNPSTPLKPEKLREGQLLC